MRLHVRLNVQSSNQRRSGSTVRRSGTRRRLISAMESNAAQRSSLPSRQYLHNVSVYRSSRTFVQQMLPLADRVRRLYQFSTGNFSGALMITASRSTLVVLPTSLFCPRSATVRKSLHSIQDQGTFGLTALCTASGGKRYDDNGKTAAAGTPIPGLLDRLTAIPFITAPPPKSAGREIFSAALLDELLEPFLHPMIPAEDIIATLTAFTAWSIAENIRRFGNTDACIVVSGGGAKNSTLLAMLQSELPSSRIIHFADRAGIPDTAKEAVLMAYLAYRTLGGLPSNLPSVTGAHKQATLGSITLP